ncbi:hypothetical protein [Luteolibacter luteus]|uniref:Choice-of-anchor D domain-containing protein n=1 Tax=Luteolibacter luteus TaxID=2728835 RepID=A0A858RE12_9BACT|nr:hypothetical protein [Luteolibacter luteus]QJE94649.1 hypothetical protein HHL09_02240 [Luteolibacter luteus]
MKYLLPLLATTALSGLALAAAPPDSGAVPEGIAASDWSGIRAAHEASRHAPHRQDNGHLVTRNPGQQWLAEFDGKGFTVTPDHGDWTWGLDLTGYGNHTLSSASSPAQLRYEGGKITCQRDENLTEWFINDTRGLEQGWNLQKRPERTDQDGPLQLHLSNRGGIRPQISAEGDCVSFQREDGSSALTYGGLKAWDADGKKLSVRFEQAGEGDIRILVEDQTARYPITIDPVVQQARLAASNAGLSDYFGSAVATSGNTVVVAARNEDSSAIGVNGDQTNNAAPESGAVYVFVRANGVWVQQAYLKASNTGAGDQFGRSVAISGDTLVVGARDEDSASIGVNGDQSSNAATNSGAVYVFTRTGATWSQQAYLKANNAEGGFVIGDCFGASVAVSGDTVVVGAPEEDSAATGVNGDASNNSADGSGAAYVFVRSGSNWSQQAYLKASNTNTADLFGGEVAISGDTVVVGASRERSAATGVNGDQSNNSVFGAGAAYVFTRSGTAWSQQAYLKASNTAVASPGNSVGYLFGSSVAISGDTVVVGSPGEESAATGVNGDQTSKAALSSGAAYVFARSGTAWAQQAYLKASNTGTSDNFGVSVGISGDKLIVGAVFESSDATGVDGDQISNAAGASGAAYIFNRSGTTWTQQSYLKASDTAQSASFGSSVGISPRTAVVGAFQPDIYVNPTTNITHTGAAYTFNIDPAPEISIRQAEASLPNGATKPVGIFVVGTSTEVTFDLLNLGVDPLTLTGTPKVALTGSSDFTVSTQPSSPVGDSGQTLFKVSFAPTSQGPKAASLSISSNDANNSSFVIQLTGTGLTYTTDTDGDGLDDATEFTMAPLGFDWQTHQGALATAYLASLNGPGFYDAAQIQALHPGTSLLAKDPVSNRFKLTAQWEKSTDLAEFLAFPAPADSSVSISPSGGVEFEFASPESAGFFRINQD